ncbi:hypothetical protein [Blastopirellula marina]|uniref:Uncharacterized protein n=1 Tax=Blastopirellula marina TaxID=124 RepID=A0A2S8GMC0_9BACT|nr:hypothetical protein [Blastopirellula marina]PQO45586.1 hypothetical protein C5Y93_14190 [Blastopirellula marina]
MKYSLTGTAANGLPVSRLVEFPDEAAVRTYAEENGITVRAIRVAPNQGIGLPGSPQQRLRSTSGTFFMWAWICLIAGVLTLFIPAPFACVLLPVAFLLFILGGIYGANATVAEAVEANKNNAR